jgi:mono/diheme cytochrome c family protein
MFSNWQIDRANNRLKGEIGMKYPTLTLLIVACGIALFVVSSCSREKEKEVEKTNIEKVETASIGKALYTSNCLSCHGEKGKGDGIAAKTLEITAKNLDLSDSKYLSTMSNESLINVINKGGLANGKAALMPPYGSILSKDDISNVVAYIRTDLCKCEYKE